MGRMPLNFVNGDLNISLGWIIEQTSNKLPDTCLVGSTHCLNIPSRTRRHVRILLKVLQVHLRQYKSLNSRLVCRTTTYCKLQTSCHQHCNGQSYLPSFFQLTYFKHSEADNLRHCPSLYSTCSIATQHVPPVDQTITLTILY